MCTCFTLLLFYVSPSYLLLDRGPTWVCALRGTTMTWLLAFPNIANSAYLSRWALAKLPCWKSQILIKIQFSPLKRWSVYIIFYGTAFASHNTWVILQILGFSHSCPHVSTWSSLNSWQPVFLLKCCQIFDLFGSSKVLLLPRYLDPDLKGM